MKKTVLIAGKPCSLTEDLVKTYLSAGYSVAVTSYNTPRGEVDDDTALLQYDLNRRSPLSARSCILQVLNRFETLDEAVVIHSAEGERRPLHELSPASIEESIDGSVKGQFFLLKEILSYFMREKDGTLSLVSFTYGEEVLTPIDAAANGSFQALTDSLFTYYRNEPLLINGFESQSSNTSEFASYILNVITEKGVKSYGKWFKYSDRGGFLSGISRSGIKRG